jgi:plastocyanin
MPRFSLQAIALAAIVLLTASCGGGSKVGSEKLLDFNEEARRRLGEKAQTKTPTPTRAVNESQRRTPPPRAAVGGRPTPAPAKKVATIEIAIQSDSAGTAFDPVAAKVFVGSIARWTNRDTTTRSVVADGGQFQSGPIAPGRSWSYVTRTAGRFNYHDGTRPYAVASLEVVAR